MALTLQDMREGASDKVAEQVVDTFLRESEILQMVLDLWTLKTIILCQEVQLLQMHV